MRARGGGGEWEGGKMRDSFSLYPSNRLLGRDALIVSRDRSMTAYK